jgi:hypothetical protein
MPAATYMIDKKIDKKKGSSLFNLQDGDFPLRPLQPTS